MAMRSALYPEVLPPWVPLSSEWRARQAGLIRLPTTPHAPWVAKVVGRERALFLAGLLPTPGARVSIPRERVPAHPWAMFVSDEEWLALREESRGATEGCRNGGRVPAMPHPVRWWVAEKVDGAPLPSVPGIRPEDEAEAGQVFALLRGERDGLDEDVSRETIATVAEASWLFEAPGHGAKRRVARALLAQGVDIETTAKVAHVDMANVRRLARG